MLKKYLFLIPFIMLFCSACFSPWSGGKGTLIIHLPGSSAYHSASAARSIVTDDEAVNLRYDFTLTGPGRTITGSFSGQTSFSAEVVPGQWTVSVKGYGKKDGNPYESEIALRAMGTADVSVRAGQTNHAAVGMVTATEVTTWEELLNVVISEQYAEYKNREEYIIVKNDLTVTETATIQRKITILADSESVTIARNFANGPVFFSVEQGGYLTLGEAGSVKNLILDGMNLQYANSSLVAVEENATFIMNDGVTLRNNKNDYESGGGIRVNGGTFEMNGGEISGNNAADGGGVHIVSNGTFIMNGGKISKNITGSGGGVYVSSGTFKMSGGIIGGEGAGNTAGIDNSGGGGGVYVDSEGTFYMSGNSVVEGNEAVDGGGVYVYEGTFTMDGGTIGGAAENNRNIVSNRGGGVYVTGDGAEFTMNDGIIEKNTANTNSGGGVSVASSAEFVLNKGTISGNGASNDTGTDGGGGVLVFDVGEFTMNGGLIKENTAGSGGGVSVVKGSKFTMKNGVIGGNTVSGNGGGVYLEGNGTGEESMFTMIGGLIGAGTYSVGNEAGSYGGGVYIGGNYVQIEITPDSNISIAGNKANVNGSGGVGGGIFIQINNAISTSIYEILKDCATGNNPNDFFSE